MATFLMTLAVPDDTGASQMACQFAEALQRRGHSIIVMHGPPPLHSNGTAAPSILPAMQRSGIATQIESRLSSPWSPLLLSSIVRFAKAHKVSAVIGVNQRDRSVAANVARQLAVPSIICAQNQHRFWGPLIVPWLKRKYYTSQVAQKADLFICSSPHVEYELTHAFGVPPKRTSMLPNAIDVAAYSNVDSMIVRSTRESLGATDDEFLWVNVGRIDYQKGQDVLLRAARQLSKHSQLWRLVFVGDVTTGANAHRMNSYFRDLRCFVDDNKLNGQIHFANWRNDVPAILGAADGYVHSARYEGLSLAILQAMSASCAIATVDNASRPPGFEHGFHGLVAQPDDPQSLASSMAELMSMTAGARTELGANARMLAEREYDIRAVGDKFCDLIETSFFGISS